MKKPKQPTGKFDYDTGLWIATEPWDVDLLIGYVLDMDAGFKSDGASIPRWLWSLVGPRYDCFTFPAALAHDALYAAELLSRASADSIFRNLLILCGTSKWKAWAYYLAVRGWAWRAWNNHTAESIEAARKQVRLFVYTEAG